MHSTSSYLRLVLGAVLALSTTAASAPAGTVTYTIVSELSYANTVTTLNTSNTANGAPVPEQSGILSANDGLPQSSVMHFQGSIVGDLNAGVLSFSPNTGTLIDALPHPNIGSFPFDPGHDAFDVNRGDETNFSLLGRRFDNNQTFLMVAARDRQFDLTGGSVADGALPSTMTMTLLHGRNNYFNAPLNATSISAAAGYGVPLLNLTPLAVSLTSNGVAEQLVIPFTTTESSTQSGFSAGTTLVSTTTRSGQLVAVRLVPEPSTWALAVLAGLGVFGTNRGRRRLPAA